MPKLLFRLSLVSLLLYSHTISPALAAPEGAKVALGYLAPDFEVISLEGGEKAKLSDFRGETVLINFWATWCAPCVDELPDLAKLHNHFKDQKFRVLAVNVDKSRRAGGRFAKENKLEMPLYWTEPGDGLQDRFQATMLPTTYIINRDGVIVSKEYGPKPWFSEEIKTQIGGLVKSHLQQD